ncbi:hypothetical protein PALA111701_01980 [Paenibacillus lactis]
MSKGTKFSVVIESPQRLEIGSGIHVEGKIIVVTSIRKVEYVNDRLVLVSGTGTIQRK